jgi:hypothetical protein
MRHRLLNQKVFIEDDPSVNILLEKYKLLRSEALQNSARNNRQVAYIQVYGVFLFTVTGVFFGLTDTVSLSKIPSYFRLPVLVLSAALLFYYYSQIYLSSFTFRVLRLRMAELEKSINKHAGSSLLRYEREIAPSLFGRMSLDGRYLLPNAWLQWFTFILFTIAIYLLVVLSTNLLAALPGLLIFYIGSILFFGFTLVWENFRLSFPGSISLQTDQSSDHLTIVLRLSRYVLNYSVVLFITFVALFNQFGDPLSSIVTGFISNFVASASLMTEQLVLLFVALYTAACAVFLPTPSELPLALSAQISVSKLVLVSAIGKSVGSLLLYFASFHFLKANNHSSERWQSYLTSGAISGYFGRNHISIAYVILQAIPFAPMRSSTVAYASLSSPSPQAVITVSAGSFVGTISRMLIIGFLITAGMFVLPSAVASP